jgi:hypothetical protein
MSEDLKAKDEIGPDAQRKTAKDDDTQGHRKFTEDDEDQGTGPEGHRRMVRGEDGDVEGHRK